MQHVNLVNETYESREKVSGGKITTKYNPWEIMNKGTRTGASITNYE